MVDKIISDFPNAAFADDSKIEQENAAGNSRHGTGAQLKQFISAKGSDIASAGTTDIGAATGDFVDVTGTTTITALGTIAAGIERTVRFTGALTLTHNATSLILPGAANIVTAAGDVARFRSLGSGNWVCVGYQRASEFGVAGLVLVSSWTYSSDVANVDFTNLGNYSELLVLSRLLTSSTSSDRRINLSVDNGSTFYSASGDYIVFDTSAEGNADSAGSMAGTSSASARSFWFRLENNINGSPKFCRSSHSSGHRMLVASNSIVDAIRVKCSSGNITGGSIYVFGRK